MTSLFDKMNLRPGERRLVVFIGAVVFVVLNFLLVYPHFGDLGDVKREIRKQNTTLRIFKEKIARQPEFDAQLRSLAKQGVSVAPVARALELQRDVTSQAALCNVSVQRSLTPRGSSSGKTNAFFDEQSLIINVDTGEEELLCFLYNLAKQSSLIRVLSMTLQPEPRRQRLQGNITLVASYHKKAPTTSVGSTPDSPAPASAPPKPVPKPTPKPVPKPIPGPASKPEARPANKPVPTPPVTKPEKAPARSTPPPPAPPAGGSRSIPLRPPRTAPAPPAPPAPGGK